ncbi:hypothetical protein EP10_002548 [Geobacillus icigianus]|uniref:Uncharacterized protein n=1 Tax=Geobacillus icigianus TaxID=1430331 RepID=A0ABU6BJ22_9BACL|nr:hypothetical protein [Geobacillus icigianus]
MIVTRNSAAGGGIHGEERAIPSAARSYSLN